MIAGALAWLDRGFAVFPLKPRGKVPLGSLVPRGFLDASNDPAVIRDWWRRAPKANIGLRTGDGHFVLDLDDAEAVAWFSNACGRHGGAPKLQTLIARTSRGFHVFFACDAEVPNSVGRLAPGVDVRGEGGYVVAAPSIHPTATSTRSRASCRSRKRHGPARRPCNAGRAACHGAGAHARVALRGCRAAGQSLAFFPLWQTHGRVSATESRSGPHAGSTKWFATA